MIKSLKNIFDITNKYIILLTPLILFSLVSNIYLAISANGKVINLLFAIILSGVMFAAFIAGWFKMVKLTVATTLHENNPNNLMKEFISGVGEYFLPTLGLTVIGFLFTIFSIVLSSFACMHFIGDPGVTGEALLKATATQEALKAFLASLSIEQLEKLNAWNTSIFFTIGTAYLLMFLYIPALFFKTKNPIMAFLIGIKDLFNKKFFKTLFMYILIFTLNGLISLLTVIFSGNIITSFITTLLNFYFITVVAVGVFHYYYNSYILPQIGQNIDLKI